MKLSTKSRYGTRLMLEMAQRYYTNGGNSKTVQLSDISKRQDISLKYLEQIVIPLKKKKYISSIRGAKGGYMLEKSPKDITVGEVVALFEGGEIICDCSENPEACEKVKTCLTRTVWIEAAKAMFEKLNSITFEDLIKNGKDLGTM